MSGDSATSFNDYAYTTARVEIPASPAERPHASVKKRSKYGYRSIVLTDTEFGLTGLGTRQMHQRVEVGRVVSAMFAAPKIRQDVFVLDRGDRLLLRLRGDAFPPESMNQFVDALGVPVTDFPDIVTRPPAGHAPVGRVQLTDYPGYVTPAEFDEEHPGLLSPRDLRPRAENRAIAFLFVVLALVAIGVYVFAIITAFTM